jgi:enoyl-CoA hydratase
MMHMSKALRCAAAAEPLVLCEIDAARSVAVVTMNRPKALNALNVAIAAALAETLEALDANPAVNAIVITGASRAFVAGADIKMMKDMTFADWSTDDVFKDFDRVRAVKKPLIAAVNGFCLGGGCELAMLCDIIYASEKAVFGQPEIKLGTIPGLGGTQRLTRMIGKSKAMEWVLTGKTYSADEAEKAGLVAKVFKPEELIKEATLTAATIAGYSRITTRIAKETVNKSMESSLAEGLAFEKRSFHATFATADQKEGMAAFAEKRKPAFTNQ